MLLISESLFNNNFCHPERIRQLAERDLQNKIFIMLRQHNYYVYIMSSFSCVLYVGVTEYFTDINSAVCREKEIKAWRREKKINLIKQKNSVFKDLYSELLG